MIHLKGVTKQYPGNIVAIRNITLHIEPGEFVSVVGQSGAGKSTIVRLLMAEEAETNPPGSMCRVILRMATMNRVSLLTPIWRLRTGISRLLMPVISQPPTII